MTDTAVRRLTLTLSRTVNPHGARARIEDALRCAGDDPRLLLLRRLHLGMVRAGALKRSTEAALRRAAGGAVHATTPSAASAEAVYFADAQEARAVLLALLVAGQRPSGWFWRLAVPEWDGADWPVAASRLLPALTIRPGGGVALARAVWRLVENGRVTEMLGPISAELVAALMPHLGGPSAWLDAEPQGGSRTGTGDAVTNALPPATPLRIGEAPAPRIGAAAANAVALLPRTHPTAAALARRVIATLPTAARLALRGVLAARAADDPVAVWLAIQIVLAEAPHLAGSRDLLTAAAGELRREMTAAIPVPVIQARTRQTPQTPAGHIEPPPDAAAHPIVTPVRHLVAAKVASPAVPPNEEQRSEVAGLFLLIRPMARVGLGEWLETHPQQAADGFAWALLREIATRMRVRESDPVWLVLPAEAARDEWLDAWRVGLDRWLRRRTGARLSEIVRRPGWLTLADGSVTARFRLRDADIRLRRHALDVDPGWVPWLGQAFRYAYSDHPPGLDRG